MKFGKGIMGELLASNPEWAPFWLNYKQLKKRIKSVAKVPRHPGMTERDIAECELEVAFFKDLQSELKKISMFFSSEEKRCVFRFQQLRSVLKDLKKRDRIDAFEAQRLMFALVHFYRECIRLENFAVMNYQGFSKILKKHDKMTGFNTRTKYMRRKVNHSPFSNYPILLQVLECTEDMFHEVDRDTRMNTAVSAVNMKINVDDQVSPTGSTTSTCSSGSSIGTPTGMMYPSMAASLMSRQFPAPISNLPTVTTPSSGPMTFPASVLWRPEEEDRPRHVGV
ncbi:hypothetical protein Poli38472_000744 [Pythium oligandrum]|uniref:SPX domain-containing protein n=1 Tax=Pythium oligandrum TaxID=41045 RepID=A0A8K1CED5_PYTOL|nr:hypothetical protein Poli38472_000744 [Pythium oligandrum]|eukprot:TMW60702.1 hypothetical protein Poli38472_000744 [Pythium oligandrum]